MKRTHWLLLLAVSTWWTLEGLVTTGQLLTMQVGGAPIALPEALRRGLLSSWLWIPCSLLLLGAARRFPLERGGLARAVPVLLAATMLVVVLRAVMIHRLNPWLGWYDTLPPFGSVLLTSLFNNFLLAWLNIGIGCAWLYAERARDRLRQAERLQARLTETRLESLRAQLDPHFLFNALNSIAETIHHDPVAADRMLVGLGELLRASLDQRQVHEVQLGEELCLLRHYLAIEQARLGDRLRVHWSVAAGMADTLVPPLLLQPLAENAIRHAIAARPGPGRLEVAAWSEDGALCLAIRDDGDAFEAGVRPGIGLSNIRERLECLHGTAQSLRLQAVPGGTEAQVRLPLRRAACLSARAA